MIIRPTKRINAVIKAFLLGIVLPFTFAIVLIGYFNVPSKSESKLLINAKLIVTCKNYGGIVKDSIDSTMVNCKNGIRVYYNNLSGDEVLEEFNRLKQGVNDEHTNIK